jgi:hypothetical protein
MEYTLNHPATFAKKKKSKRRNKKMKKNKIDQQIEKNRAKVGEYKVSDRDSEIYELFKSRKQELIKSRQNVVGRNIEDIWKAADNAYIPHELKANSGTKGFLSEEDGWRSIPTVFKSDDDWQEDSAPASPYVKIQTALSILIDRNPKAVFKAATKQYEQSSVLMKELYNNNWDTAKSKEQLKLLVLNGAKYGVFCGRTAVLDINRKVRDVVSYNPEDPSQNQYEEQNITIYNDVYRWALDPWKCWFDDMSKPGDPFSMNDWMRYDDISWDAFVEKFGKFKNFKYVTPHKQVESSDAEPEKKVTIQSENTVRLWFYENLSRDTFYIQTEEGVVLVNEPIPFSPKNKRLSCWVAPWTLRHQSTVYGIGVYEAMRNDYKLYTKIRNMTMDQLVQSIYKSFFYEGTNTLSETGEIRTKPGRGIQMANPKSVVWNEVPGPGKDAWSGIEFTEKQIDDSTGITKTLEGELSPNAKAFDIAQTREASLRRLKLPLDNLGFVLEQDAYISTALFEELYSEPEVMQITDPDKILEYRTESAKGLLMPNEMAENLDGSITINKFREFPLYVDRDKEGNILQTKEEKFFKVKPEDLSWEGKISITGQSVIAESPLLEKQNKLEMANLLIPLFVQPPEIVMPAAKQILKAYDEDPEDWLPTTWLQMMQQTQSGEQPQPQLFIDQAQAQPMGQAGKVVPSTQAKPTNNRVAAFNNKINPMINPQ